VTRGSNRSFTTTFPSRSAGTLLLVVVIVLQRNVPRRTRDPDDDDHNQLVPKAPVGCDDGINNIHNKNNNNII